MNYPLISEYVEAIKSAEDNFDKLRHLRPVLDEDDNPVMTSGNFAVVFKMWDEEKDKYFAVKCFLKDQPNRAENYRMIAEELEYVSSSFLTKFQYLDGELFVDSANADGDEFPVLLMDWVDGINLDQYIRQHLDDSYQLHLLAYQFSRLAMWLMPQPFAHGDLKPDNIMVREDGTLVLIDYDGMFVPAMKGQKARELGSPDFRHPARSEDAFNEHIDDFSIISILLSLRAIAEEPSLLEAYGAADRLLFSEKDYRNIHSCQLLQDLFPSECAEVNTLVGLFIIALTQSDLSNVSFRLLSLERPKEPEIEIISTEVTEEDEKDAWTDEFGVKYSKDGKKLLVCTNYDLVNYSIRKGTKCICDRAFELRRFLETDTIISDRAFWVCDSLESVTIPDSVTSIGNYAFISCKSLQTVIIPNSVISIGDSAFSGCSSLQSVTIPDSVTTISGNPFVNCPAKIINLSKHFTIFEGNLYTSDMKRLTSYLLKEDSFTIPDSVASLGAGAFDGCKSLRSVTIPDSVTSIGDSAFEGCESLRSVTIPDSVTSIGDLAFDGCKSLRSVTIADSVTSIGDRAFSGCSSLESVTIPDSVTSIGDRAFEYCESLQSVTIPDSVTSIGYSAFYDCKSLQSVTIPDSVASIGDCAFKECRSLHSVTIPDSVTSIGGSAFWYCESLQSVTIPDSVTSIGNSAFSGCKSLESITIPDSVASIGDCAFKECRSLHSVTIPDSVTSIGGSAFEDCYSLESVTIPDSVTSIGDSAFLGCKSLESVTIPDSVTSLGGSAFLGCSSLHSVTIPDSVTSIGNSAFLGCESLHSVTIPDSVTSILKNPFINCPAKINNLSKHFAIFEGNLYTSDMKRLISYLSKVDSYTIPDSVTSIGYSAFEGCESLRSVTIPDSVTSIGDLAFRRCKSLRSVTIPNSVTSIGKRVFEGCKSLVSVTIPDSVTSIGYEAFAECNSLESVTIPDSVTSIGDGAFVCCESLQSVTIPDSVTIIGYEAFSGCLQSIFISRQAYDRLKNMLWGDSSKIKFTD